MELRFQKVKLRKQLANTLFSIGLTAFRFNRGGILYPKVSGTPEAMSPVKLDASLTYLYKSGVIASSSSAKFYVWDKCIIPKHFEKDYGWAHSLDCLESPPFYYKATTLQPEYSPRTELPPSSGIIVAPGHDLITNSFDLVWDKSVTAASWVLKIINKTSGVTIREDTLTVDASGTNNVSRIDNFPPNVECYLVLYGDSNFVDSKIVEYISANRISISSPNNGIYDDDVDVVFNIPAPYVMTLTKYGEGTVPFELPSSHLIHLQDVPTNLTSIAFEGYAVDGLNKFYYVDSSLFDPLILPTLQVTGTTILATTKWGDELSWTVIIRSEDNSVLYWYESGIPAGTRSFSLPLLPNNGNYNITLQYTKDTGAQSVSVVVPSPTAIVTKNGQVVSWTSLPLLESVKVDAIYNGQVVDTITKPATAPSSHTFTNIPQGLAGYITYKATYTKYNKESYAEASFLENPTVFTIPAPYRYYGDEILLKWNQIQGTHDSLKITTSNGDEIAIQPDAVEQWVPVASTIALYSVKNNQDTLLEAGLFSFEDININLVSEPNIQSSSYLMKWSQPSVALAWLRANLLSDSPTLPASATQHQFTTIPVDPAIIPAFLLFEYNGVRHKTHFNISNSRMGITLVSPDSIFSGSSHRVSWNIIHDTTGYPHQYTRVEIINDGGASIIVKDVAAPTSFVDISNLPLTGEQLKVRLTAYATNGASVSTENTVLSYSTYPVYPEISSPSPMANLTGVNSIVINRKNIALNSWVLKLGTNPHGDDIFNSGSLPLTSPSSISIPTIETGQTVYATLQSVLENQTTVRSYQRVYTSQAVPAKVVRTFLHSKLGKYTLEPHGETVNEWGIKLIKNGNTLFDLYPIQGSFIETSAHEILGEDYQLVYKVNGSSSQPVVLLEDVGDVDIINPTSINANTFSITWNNNDVTPDSWKVRVKNSSGVTIHESSSLPSSFSSYTAQDVSLTESTLTVEVGYKYGSHPYIFTSKAVPVNAMPAITDAHIVTSPSRGIGIHITSNNAGVDHYDLYINGVLVQGNIPASQGYIFIPINFNGGTGSVILTTTLTNGTTVSTQPTSIPIPLDYPYIILPEDRPSLDTAVLHWHIGDLPVSNFYLKAGLSQGADDLLQSVSLPGTTNTYTLAGLPVVPGNTVYYTLSFEHNGNMQDLTHSFSVMPEPIFVLPQTHLDGQTANILLQDPSGMVNTWRVIINGQNGNKLYDSNFNFNTHKSYIAHNMPIDGSPLTFKILYTLQGIPSTFVVEKSVTAYQPPAIPDSHFTTEILDANGMITERIPDYQYTFEWVDGGVSPANYRVIMGNTPNSSNKYNSGLLPGSARSHLVTGIPDTGEDLYLTLLWYI